MAGKLLIKGMLTRPLACFPIGLPRALGAAALTRSMASEAQVDGAAAVVPKA